MKACRQHEREQECGDGGLVFHGRQLVSLGYRFSATIRRKGSSWAYQKVAHRKSRRLNDRS